MSAQFRLEPKGEFVVYDYNTVPPFASFFPGIAGLFGIPLWVFYVNRGQCIASVGIRSKDEPIMEFWPANKAYQLTPSQGFRTFLKIQDKKTPLFYEPFSVLGRALNPRLKNKMIIRPYDLSLAEENRDAGLRISVNTFSLPNESFASLARALTIENISKRTISFELLDGASVVVPHGVNNWFLKEMSRTIEAWMRVEGVQTGVPVFKLATDPRDTAQVSFIKGANFYTSFDAGAKSGDQKILVDPSAIFGEVSDFSYPALFVAKKNYRFPQAQAALNKTPCAFTFKKARLAPGARLKLYSLLGHVFDVADIKKAGLDSLNEAFVEKKSRENRILIDSIMDRIFTASGQPAFDLYARQTYLDNVLRGGMPYTITEDGKKKSIYVYSRKHGDLERDYNRFYVSPTYLSEGEGNYRDVNQNRRMDLFFDPEVAEKNIVDFLNLIQLDGYNPLIFKGDRFIVSEKDFKESGLSAFMREKDAKKIAHILAKPFSAGDILAYIEENKVFLKIPREDFAKKLLGVSCASVEASFGEGYWSDHWTYNTDLLESFLAVYPDRFKAVLLEKDDFFYYDTAVYVKPRSERYGLQHGAVRPFHALGTDEEKNALIQKRHEDKHKVRGGNGEGAVLATTLLDKLICLVANKTASLDPSGVGMEMEADKPNWYDALNGLPGLFGSSVSETFELKRLIEFLKNVFTQWNLRDDRQILLTEEVHAFLRELQTLLGSRLGTFDFWDKANVAKEAYRLKVRRGVSGEKREIALRDLKVFFDQVLAKLEEAIRQSFNDKSDLICTYFTHQVTRYASSVDATGKHRVVPQEFRQERLPLFLEGFVHALRTEKDKASDIYQAVRKSPLWDKKLRMYKVNASLEKESYEIGRAKAFTPGWLENESIWLHMEYKYLLELLKNGLYEEFYDDLLTAGVPFQDPKVYGRSTLENSSFIASSAHPDPTLHGRGFVARLSGSTAELIHMWLLMSVGPKPFFLDKNDQLSLRFAPALERSFFTKEPRRLSYVDAQGASQEVLLPKRAYGFLFLGRVLVVYHNPSGRNTFGKNGVRPVAITVRGKKEAVARVEGDTLPAPYAQQVRNNQVERLDIELGISF